MELELVTTPCPYCGEPIERLIDCSEEEQNHIEDCGVCCKPASVHVIVAADGLPSVQASAKNEA